MRGDFLPSLKPQTLNLLLLDLEKPPSQQILLVFMDPIFDILPCVTCTQITLLFIGENNSWLPVTQYVFFDITF